MIVGVPKETFPGSGDQGRKFDYEYEGAPLILAMVILSTGSFTIVVARPISTGFILSALLLLSLLRGV